ncbi:MAG: helix-turn-helix transcriptional regulator [Alphaproteobacteria bacterium]
MTKQPYIADPSYVKALRVARGHTQAQAAIACGVGLRTWHGWENGRTPADVARLRIYEMDHPVKEGAGR